MALMRVSESYLYGGNLGLALRVADGCGATVTEISEVLSLTKNETERLMADAGISLEK